MRFDLSSTVGSLAWLSCLPQLRSTPHSVGSASHGAAEICLLRSARPRHSGGSIQALARTRCTLPTVQPTSLQYHSETGSSRSAHWIAAAAVLCCRAGSSAASGTM